MNPEIKFSEAAQLYARNAAIVDAMYRAFRDELHEFWTDVFTQMRELEPDWAQQGEPGKAAWFMFRPPTQRKNNPFFYVDSWEAPEVITHGQIRLYGALENAKEAEKVALRAMANEPNCSEGKGSAHDLFRVNLTIGLDTSARDIAEKIIEVADKMQTAVEKVS